MNLCESPISEIIRRRKCNQPVKSESGVKRFVVRACQGGQERIVRFGDASIGHYKERASKCSGNGDAGRRANFKARHNCSEKKGKLKPSYRTAEHSSKAVRKIEHCFFRCSVKVRSVQQPLLHKTLYVRIGKSDRM